MSELSPAAQVLAEQLAMRVAVRRLLALVASMQDDPQLFLVKEARRAREEARDLYIPAGSVDRIDAIRKRCMEILDELYR